MQVKHKHFDLISRWARNVTGHEVQVLQGNSWVSVDFPTWDPERTYRLVDKLAPYDKSKAPESITLYLYGKHDGSLMQFTQRQDNLPDDTVFLGVMETALTPF